MRIGDVRRDCGCFYRGYEFFDVDFVVAARLLDGVSGRGVVAPSHEDVVKGEFRGVTQKALAEEYGASIMTISRRSLAVREAAVGAVVDEATASDRVGAHHAREYQADGYSRKPRRRLSAPR